PERFYDLVVEVAIIRPGPIVGQMVHPYLARRAGREPVHYAHPALEPILARTLGVPLFQEQLLRMAMAVAGFTAGEAEELRRAMGFKRSEARMQTIETKLRAGMAARGITGRVQDEVERVAHAGAFAAFGLTRREALWQSAAGERDPASLLARVRPRAAATPLPPMTPFEETAADYAATHLTPGPHVMAYLRARLRVEGVLA